MQKVTLLLLTFILVMFQSETSFGLGSPRPKPSPNPTPGPKFDVVIKVYDGDTTRDDLRLGGAQVNLGGVTQTSDVFGFTLFNVSKGTYNLTIQANNFVRYSGSIFIDRTRNEDDPASPNSVVRVALKNNCGQAGVDSFTACYFNNSDLTGLKEVRNESSINFDWGEGSPSESIENDTFSARWSGSFNFEEKEYEFSVTSDDGVRLYVDDELIIDNWTDHSPQNVRAVKALSGGRHKVVMEYYEGVGGAVARLNWSEKKPFEQRQGLVRLNGRTLYDDNGAFNALGATLFSAARYYKFDRPKLERELATLRDGGFHYIRALGVVAWEGRDIDWRWSDYADVIAGVTDLAYDKYGLRVQWTIFGDAQIIIPNRSDQRRLVEQFINISRGREHKIIMFEVANESWQNGFGGDEGESSLRSFARLLNDNTQILVATSAPATGECSAFERINPPGVTDVGIMHFDRNVSKTDGMWRPVRQPWEYQFCKGPDAGSNNEPIGPGSSVAWDDDPMRLVMAAVTTYQSGMPFYVFHSRAGVGIGEKGGYKGDQPMSEMRGWDSFKNLNKYMPAGSAGWTRHGHGWDGNPLIIYGDGKRFYMTTDGAQNGCMRNYAVTNGSDFVVAPIGCKGRVEFEARFNMSLEVYNPLTGDVQQRLDLNAGQRFELSGDTAWVLKGQTR